MSGQGPLELLEWGMEGIANLGVGTVRVASQYFINVESFSELGGFHIPYLDQAAEAAASAMATDVPQMRYLFAMALAYPICLLISLMPTIPSLRHFTSFASGLLFSIWVFGAGWIHTVITAGIVYLFLVFTNFLSLSNPIRRQRQFAVLIFVMAYMTLSHLYRLYIDYLGWTLDFTGPQMMLTIKLTTLVFNLSDGQEFAVEFDKREAALNEKVAKAKVGGIMFLLSPSLSYYHLPLTPRSPHGSGGAGSCEGGR